MTAPLYKIRLIPPTPKDRIDTLARIEIVWLPEAGAWYGTKITGIMIKNAATDPSVQPPQPFVMFPSRWGRGKVVGSYIEPEDNEQGYSTRRLQDMLLQTYKAWADERRARLQAPSQASA